jgi:hypothetical protein
MRIMADLLRKGHNTDDIMKILKGRE